MILSDSRKAGVFWIRKLSDMKWLIGLVLLISTGLMVGYFWPEQKVVLKDQGEKIINLQLDMEAVNDTQFVANGHLIGIAEKQSAEEALSGQYSCKIPVGEGLQYGLDCPLPQLEPGDYYKISIWKYGEDAQLVVAAPKTEQFYLTTAKTVKKEKGWDLLRLYFRVPMTRQLEGLKTYVYTNGETPVYFDDLSIEYLGNTKDSFTLPLADLRLQVDEKALQQLQNKRKQALRNGILETNDEDWVNGKIVDNTEGAQKVKLRLKGDWLDHLNGKKWSFRVKMKGQQSWNRMRVFSLHTPKARSFLYEWILHQFFEREDILTTRYDFTQLYFNDESLGIYACEEHFDKVLVESRARREGPIIKFVEDGFWAGIKRQLYELDGVDYDIKNTERLMETAEIRAFNESTLLNNEKLAADFRVAHTLLDQYRYGLKSPDEIFDLDRMAKYFAITDVMSAYHGVTWHNQRFYYNPVTQKLEPIGFDGYADHIGKNIRLLGQGAFNRRRIDKEELHNKLFLDRDFTELYIRYLYQYSDRDYLEQFFAEIREGLRFREQLLQEEFEEYEFDYERFRIISERVRVLLLPFENLSLRTYTDEVVNGKKNIAIANLHHLPLQLVGYGSHLSKVNSLDQEVLLESFTPRLVQGQIEKNNKPTLLDTITGDLAWTVYHNQDFLSFRSLQVPASAKYLFFKPLGIDTVFSTLISNSAPPLKDLALQTIAQENTLQADQSYQLSDGMVYFPAGKHTIKENLFIPSGLRVTFAAGAKVNLTNDASIISYSPIIVNGQPDKPVTIHSEDKTGRGLAVINADQVSKIHYGQFINLSNPSIDNWQLSGAVNFYESEVEFNHSVIRDNYCEDALNIIRSDFSFNSSRIANTQMDGLDSDFSRGYLSNATFFQVGNDGLDVSGSNILAENIYIDQAGDKGISVGEESDLTLTKGTIKNCNIALASKDLSILLVKSVDMIDCKQGFAAYQKKNEYGGGTIIVEKYSAENVDRLYNIRKGSRLQIEGKVIDAIQ